MHRISIRGISTVTAVVVATATLGITTDAFGSPDRPVVDSTPVSALAVQQASLLKSRGRCCAHAPTPGRSTSRPSRPRTRSWPPSTPPPRSVPHARAAAARKAAALRASRAALSVRPGSNRALGRDMAAARGWGDAQFVCLDSLWSNESGWSQSAANSSGAYGIPQAKPGSKMASAGSDWATNPRTQIAWGLSYIGSRYGSPCGAWSNFQARGYY